MRKPIELALSQFLSLDGLFRSLRTESDAERFKAARDRGKAMERLRVETRRMELFPEVCPVCSRKKMNDPGDYYHEKHCDSYYYQDWIRDRPGSIEDEAMLRSLLELARYTGD